MRSNYYSKTSPDPLAATPLDAISARGDLMNPPIYGGPSMEKLHRMN